MMLIYYRNYGNDLIFHKYIALRLRLLPFFAGIILEKFLTSKSAQDTVKYIRSLPWSGFKIIKSFNKIAVLL